MTSDSHSMSWLGSGLSQITGQISNFTKEVLTEGTEEVDDHATELLVAKAKFNDLEGQHYNARVELERTKHINEELTENLKSSELQIKAISSEYREKLKQQEEEIKLLKQQHHAVLENQSKLAVAGTSPSSPGSSINHPAPLSNLHAFGGDEHDFDDVVSGQRQINRLQTEVDRLSAECRHWKKVAKTQKPDLESASLDGSPSDSGIADLHDQIKDLEQQLAKEIDNHQDELSALQSIHSQKLKSLSRKQAEEKAEYEETIRELQGQIQAAGLSVKETGQFKAEIKELSEANKQLVEENEASTARYQELLKENEALRERRLGAGDESAVEGDANHGWDIRLPSSTPRHPDRPVLQETGAFELSFSEISDKNKVPNEQVQALQSQVAAYQHEVSQFDLERSDWTMEKEALESVLMKLRTELKGKEEQMAILQAEQGLLEVERQQQKAAGTGTELVRPTPEGTASDIDIDELSYQVELLTKGNSMLESERDVLHEEKEKLEMELKKLQVRVSDLETRLTQSNQSEISNTKVSAQLEDKENEITLLKSQLKKQQERINSLNTQLEEASEGLIEKEAEIAELEERLDNSEEQAETIQNRVRKPSEEDVDVEIKKMRVELQHKSEQIDQLTVKEKKLEDLLKESQAREESFMMLEEEKKALETSLEELDAQHEEAITAVIQSKEKLIKANEQLKHRNQEIENQLLENSATETPTSSEQMQKLQSELQISQAELNKLQEEKAKRSSVIAELEEKLKNGAMALNNLHMDKQELEGEVKDLRKQVSKLSTEVANVSAEKLKVENSFTELQVQLHQTHEKLQAESTKTQINSGLQSDFQRLRQELDLSQKTCTEHNTRVAALEEEISLLQEQLTSTSQDKLNISITAADTEQSYKRQIETLCKTHEDKIDSLLREIAELKSKNVKAERELKLVEEKIKEQAKSYEDYIHEIQRTKELNASSSEDEHQRLLKENHEKELKICELEVTIGQLRSEVEDTRQELQNALDESQETSALLNDKESEISALQAQNKAYEEYLEEKTAKVHTLEEETQNLQSKAPAEYKQSAASVEPDRHELQEKIIRQLEVDLSEKTAQIESHQEELEVLKQELHEQKQRLAADDEKLKTAQRQISDQLEKVETLETTLGTKEDELKEAINHCEALELELGESQKTSQDESIQNGHLKDTQNLEEQVNNKELITPEEEYETLRNVIRQKDEVILELRNNNGSLLKLLEERSVTMHGNKSLLDMHKLSNENKTLKMEKEQMISVLNEKTRECSSLKSEVHKLMNVISAEKTALGKLQKDNQELLQKVNSRPSDEPNPDMTREAVKNLSMVIRDKDLEIESLGQKNKTLLQVLQQSSGGGELSTVFQEKENLAKQLEMYQKDREQIIVALNQKHQEAVTYHNEISRLTVLLTQNSDKQENLEREFTSLQGQFEDKQQALLKLQNELLNYKQKFSEVDDRYKEILHRQAQQVQEKVEEKVQQTPTFAASPKPSTHSSSEEASADGPSTKNQTENQSSQHIAHLNQLMIQKKDEINELKEQLREMSVSLQEKDRAISEHKRNLEVKDQILKDKDSVIEKRNNSVSESNSRLRESHEHLRKKDMEISSLRKQKDNLTFQIRGLQTELTDLKQERDNMLDRAEGVTSERTQLAEANARLSAAIGERDLEMNAMREKVATLTAAVSLVGAEKGEVEQMLADTEAMQKAAQVLQGERDQAYASLQAVQADNTAIKQQMMQLAEREQKLQRELDRLRSHLLTIEEGYTTEALAAEEREKELRNRLAAAEENAMNSSNAVQNYSVEASRQVESLQKQLHEIAEQRDRAFMDLSAAKDTASQYAASLTNLQMVLEQFQREREEHLVVETERYQRHLVERDQLIKELRDEKTDLTARLQEATDALEAAHRLSEQIDRKEEELAALKEEVVLREDELNKAEMEIEKLNSSNEGKVDKLIIKNIVLGYFHTPNNKRGEVLLLLGKVLSFSKDEMHEVGADGGSGGWLTGIFKRTLGSVTPTPTTPNRARSFFMDQSFSEMFVKFLERESSPQPTMRLPAEEMAREQQEKHNQQHQRNKPVFNPFAAPAHTMNPTSHGLPRSAESSHLLMKPMAASLPMLTPMVTALSPDKGSDVGQPTLTPPLSGRVSGNSSGRSTPASTSAILKDVLQQ